jgi:hypothetical protein
LTGFGAGSDFDTVANGAIGGARNQSNLGLVVLLDQPFQASSSYWGVTYSDQTLYAKQRLSSFLQNRYGSISALNSAWNSTYTTFGSAGGWGSGSGLLDEDGRHTGWIPSDTIHLAGSASAFQTDMNDFLKIFAIQYFSVIKKGMSVYAPGILYLGPTTLGSWGTPSRAQVYQAAASYVDMIMVATIPAGVSDDQQRIDFIAKNAGDKPWASWEGMFGQPDSYMYPYPAPDDVAPQSSKQADRAQVYVGRVNSLINAKTTSGTYPVVGLKFWELVDNWGETANWGLLTRRDNAYDGLADVIATGKDAWGYSTGGENKNFGDFLNAVATTNNGIYATLTGATGNGVAIPTLTTLAASANQINVGQSVTFTASVSAAATGVSSTEKIDSVELLPKNPKYSSPLNSARTAPTGTVQFLDGTAALGIVTLSGNTATFETSTLSQGAHSITAIYSGNVSYSGSTSNPVSVTVSPGSGVGSAAVARVNCGGDAYTDTSGNQWSADNGYNGGITYSTSNSIARTANPKLYQDWREWWFPLTYTFTVPNGTYIVALKFAEIYYSSPGQRIFQIQVNGQTVEPSFDIVAVAGSAFKKVSRSYSATVADGVLNVTFVPIVADAAINAIEIDSQ